MTGLLRGWAVMGIAVLVMMICVAGTALAAPATTLRYWLWLDDPTDPVIPALVQEFNATHPDIRVEYELIPLADYHDKLATALAAGAGPDAARFKDWWLGEFVDADLIEPLDGYLSRWPTRADVVENLWNTGKVPGRQPIYMMPHQYITFYLYYRTDWFKQAGLASPNTWDQFLEAAKRLTDPARNRYGFGLRGGAGGQDQWLAFMVAGGARLVDTQGRIVINDPAGVAANQWYIDLFRRHKVAPPSAPTDAYAQVTGAFQAGITAMMAHHVGSSVLMTQKLGDAVGVVPIPARDPAHRATMGTMSGNVVLAGSRHKDAAFTFVSWLSEQQPMDRWSRSRNGQLPVLKSVAALPHYVDNPFFRVSLEGGDYAVTWPPFPGTGYVAAQLWQAEMQRALLGQTTSQAMMDAIAQALGAR